ncbi:hypothetical protein D3C80_1229640 [compost metagenome]
MDCQRPKANAETIVLRSKHGVSAIEGLIQRTVFIKAKNYSLETFIIGGNTRAQIDFCV